MRLPHYMQHAVILMLFLLYSADVAAQLLTIRPEDKTILKDGQPWFPILNIYHPISTEATPGDSSQWFTPNYQMYDSSAANGFNGVILHWAWAGEWVWDDNSQTWIFKDGVVPWNNFHGNNSISSDLPNGQNLCEGSHEFELTANMGLRNGDSLRSFFGRTNQMFFDEGQSFVPYGMLAYEGGAGGFKCTATDPTANRHGATDFVLAHNNHASPFAGFYNEEPNNLWRDYGDQLWGEDDVEALASMFLEQRDYIRQQDNARLIFLNFSPSTAARVFGITEDGTIVPTTGPLGRQYWLYECRALGAAADIVGVDWYLNSADHRYDVIENGDIGVRTVGEYAHMLVDSIAGPLGKSSIFTMNNHDWSNPTISELKSTWTSAFVAGVKGFVIYSWVCNGEDAEHIYWRNVIRNTFKSLNEWGVLAAWDATTQPIVTAPDHLLEQLTKQVGPDQWTFAVDRSAHGSTWPYNVTFSGYDAPTGPIEVFHDGEDYSQRWLWPTSGSFTDQFERLQSHIYRIYYNGLHDTVEVKTSLVVPAGYTLTVQPGTIVRFAQDSHLLVEGTLTAIGTVQDPIYFESTGTDPSNAWRGIYVGSAGNTLENCVFENASVAIRALPGSGVSLDDCQFNDCGVAVAAVDANVTLMECAINGGSYGVLSACDSDVGLTDCDVQSTTRAGLWLQGFSRCDVDKTLFAGNGLGQTYFYGGIRNTFGTMRLHCVTSRDNHGPGLSQLGGFTDMAPASGETGKNTFIDNIAPDGPAGTQIYFDNAQFNLCNGRNKICAGDGLLIMDATPTWHDVTNNHWCDGFENRVPSEYHNGGDDGAPQNDRCALTGLSYCMETLAAELFYEAWVEENTMLYQEAYDGYKYILETYPKSPEAKLCPERIVMCTKALQQSWDERRAYFLSIADTTTDPGLEFETRASAAWCLVEKDFFDDARDEFIALLDSADDNYKAQKAALCELMIELKEAPWDSIGSLDSAPEEDRMMSVLDRMESVLSGTAQTVPRAAVPTRYALYQNYPNPFNPTTEIRFDLPEDARIELKIFNTLGQTVTTVVDDVRPAGTYRVLWDSRGASGIPLAVGVYIYQLKAGNFGDAKKMVLIR